MRVRMKVDISGTWNGVAWPQRGEVVDVDEVTGVKLVGNGQATLVKSKDDDDVVEAAVVDEVVETATVSTEPVKRGPGRPRKDG